MRRIEMGLLTFDHQIHVAKAYLHALHEAGIEVDHVLVCSFTTRYGSVRRLAESVVGQKRYIWLRERWRSHQHRYGKYAHYCSMVKNNSAVQMLAQHPSSIEQYCPHKRYLKIRDTDDPLLIDALRDSGLKHYIFAGLEMFRGAPLHIGVRFLHIHSGLVPHIRGINCFLWNWLYRGKLDYSAIYLDDGVDTGEIVYCAQMPVPHLGETSALTECEQHELFEFLIAYYSQWNKAQVLVKAVQHIINEGYPLHGQTQQEEGRQFFTAHPRMIQYFMSRLSKRGNHLTNL